MAGFDFYESYIEDAEPLVRDLLWKLQRVCRTYDLEVHFKHERSRKRYYVKVDGPLPMMQASAPVLASALPSFADGHSVPRDRRRRIRIADRLVRAYWRHVVRMGDMVFEVSARFGKFIPNSFVFNTETHSEELDERMWSVTRSLMAYENGEVGPAQLVEEIHTGLEWLMQEAIGRKTADHMTYARMVEKLRDSGVIDRDQCAQILRMKNIRRDAKHRGKPAQRDQVDEVLQSCVEACHLTLQHISPPVR